MTRRDTQGTILLPALFHARGVLAALVVGQCLAIILAFAPGADEQVWLRLGMVSLFVHCVVFLSLSCLYSLQTLMNRMSLAAQLLVGYLVIALITSSVSIFSNAYLWFAQDAGLWPFLLSNLVIAFIITSLYLQFVLLYREATQSVAAVASAELDALQARIRPHFLYNSLSTAAELTHSDPAAAEQAILALATLSRAAMHAGEKSTLQAEIELAKRYLDLEGWRFGKRLRVEWELPATIPAIEMPSLTLQPLFENAVGHGIEGLREGGVIRASLHVSKKAVTILITNPVAPVAQQRKGNGIAIENIVKRLAIYFDDRARMTRHREQETYRVKLVLPLEKER